MESKIEELEKQLGKKVISIIYPPGEEIENEDKFLIYNSLKNYNKEDVAILLNNEEGGDFFASFNVAVFLYEKFSPNLCFLVPKQCASAAVLLLFLGRKLMISKESIITQCDCYFADEECAPFWFRARENLNHPSEKIRNKAKKYHINSIKVLKQFFQTKNSLVCQKITGSTKQKESFMLRLIDNLERGENHCDRITMKKFIDLGFNIEELSDPIKKISEDIVNDNCERMKQSGKRFCIVSREGLVEFD